MLQDTTDIPSFPTNAKHACIRPLTSSKPALGYFRVVDGSKTLDELGLKDVQEASNDFVAVWVRGIGGKDEEVPKDG